MRQVDGVTHAARASGGWSLTAIWIGVIGGLTSGLLGVGGGIVMVPLLVRFLHLEQRRAHGTSLAILIFTATAAALTYRAVGRADLGLAAFLAAGAVVAAPLGARATARMSSEGLRRAFGGLLVLVGIRLFLTHLPEGAWLALPGLAGRLTTVAVGTVVGFLSGLLGVGGGVVMVPILVLLFGLPQHDAQGVSLFMVIPTAVVGAWSHVRLGNVERRIVLPVALASVVAAVCGAALANVLHGTTLRYLFGALLLVTGLRLLSTRRNGPPLGPGAGPGAGPGLASR